MPLVSSSKRFSSKLTSVQYTDSITLGELRKSVAKAISLSVHRIELRKFAPNRDKLSRDEKKLYPTYADDKQTLKSLGITSTTEIEVKDLGPQFSYRGVFIVEYLGPILIVLLYAFRPSFLFGTGLQSIDLVNNLSLKNWNAPEGSKDYNRFVQSLAIVLWVLHFAKREFETFFVHKFSRATMPLFNLFKNSMYYWGFAVGVAYPLSHPLFTAPGKTQVLIALALWIASQSTNYAVHAQLAGMRKEEGDKDRQPPKGFLFSLVSCPNYTAEVLGWVAWTTLTQIFMSGFFTIAGLIQMTEWALSKHRGYISSASTDDAKKKLKAKKAIIPFVI